MLLQSSVRGERGCYISYVRATMWDLIMKERTAKVLPILSRGNYRPDFKGHSQSMRGGSVKASLERN